MNKSTVHISIGGQQREIRLWPIRKGFRYGRKVSEQITGMKTADDSEVLAKIFAEENEQVAVDMIADALVIKPGEDAAAIAEQGDILTLSSIMSHNFSFIRAALGMLVPPQPSKPSSLPLSGPPDAAA